MDGKKASFKWITIGEYDGEDSQGRPVVCYRQYCPVCNYGTWLEPDRCPDCGTELR